MEEDLLLGDSVEEDLPSEVGGLFLEGREAEDLLLED